MPKKSKVILVSLTSMFALSGCTGYETEDYDLKYLVSNYENTVGVGDYFSVPRSVCDSDARAVMYRGLEKGVTKDYNMLLSDSTKGGEELKVEFDEGSSFDYLKLCNHDYDIEYEYTISKVDANNITYKVKGILTNTYEVDYDKENRTKEEMTFSVEDIFPIATKSHFNLEKSAPHKYTLVGFEELSEGYYSLTLNREMKGMSHNLLKMSKYTLSNDSIEDTITLKVKKGLIDELTTIDEDKGVRFYLEGVEDNKLTFMVETTEVNFIN